MLRLGRGGILGTSMCGELAVCFCARDGRGGICGGPLIVAVDVDAVAGSR